MTARTASNATDTRSRPALTFRLRADENTGVRDEVPLLLFRVSDFKSRGSTDSHSAKSEAVIRGVQDISDVDVFELNDWNMVARLALARYETGTQHNDNFVGWTASLPWALNEMIDHFHAYDLEQAEIELFVIDTRQFPFRTFIRKRTLLQRCLKNCGYRETKEKLERVLRRDDHDQKEYYSQGELVLQGRCAIVTLQQLTAGGLSRVCQDAVPYKRLTWPDRVLAFRACYKTSVTHRDLVSPEMIHTISALTDLFSVPYKALMGLWFLASRARRPTDPAILAWARSQDFEGSLMVCVANTRRLDDVLDLPEIEHLGRIATFVQKHLNAPGPLASIDRAMSELDRAVTAFGASQRSDALRTDALSEDLRLRATRLGDMATRLTSMPSEPSELDSNPLDSSKSQERLPDSPVVSIAEPAQGRMSPSSSIRYAAQPEQSPEDENTQHASDCTEEAS